MFNRRWKNWTFGFIVIAIIFWIASTSQSFQNCVHERKNGKPYEALHESGPIISRTIVRLRLNVACAGDFTDKNDSAITALATAVVAFFTFTLWSATRRLWASAEHQLAEFRRSLEQSKVAEERQSADMKASIAEAARAAVAMRDVAEAAKASAKVAETSMVTLNRALMVGTKIDVNVIVRSTTIIGYQMVVIFTNTGHTPAKNVQTNSNIVVFDERVPDNFQYADRITAAPGYGVVGPNVPITFPLGIALQDIHDIQNKTRIGLVYGWTEYDDIFEGTARRRTEFCLQIEVASGVLHVIPQQRGGPSALGFVVYGPYNAIDNDCFHKLGQVPVGGLPPVTQPPPFDDMVPI